jgi:hypothetical protein
MTVSNVPAPRSILALAVLCSLRSFSALAAGPVPLPPADLGQTNIMDGDGGPGALLELITFGYGANRLTNPRGASVRGRINSRSREP